MAFVSTPISIIMYSDGHSRLDLPGFPILRMPEDHLTGIGTNSKMTMLITALPALPRYIPHPISPLSTSHPPSAPGLRVRAAPSPQNVNPLNRPDKRPTPPHAD